MSKPLLDSTDFKILEFLANDARVSNREIADALELAEGTVRGRIKRMQEEKMIRIQAISDVRVQTGYDKPIMVYLGISAELKTLQHSAEAIAALPFVRFAATMLGRYDILAISYVGSNEELIQHINEDIMAVPGVRHVETKLAIKSLKYDYRWGSVVG